MSNITRRIEKVEAAAQAQEAEANDRRAKLQDLQHLEKDNPVAAMLLEKELETGRRYTLAMALAELDSEDSK